MCQKQKLSDKRTQLTPNRPAMPFATEKNILKDIFSSVLSQFKKYHPSGNLII